MRAGPRAPRRRKSCPDGSTARRRPGATNPRRSWATQNATPASSGPAVPGSGSSASTAPELEVHPPRLAEVREADQHAVARPRQAAQLVLGLGDPERRQRRGLGVERRGLAERHLLERRGVVDQRARLGRRDIPAPERWRGRGAARRPRRTPRRPPPRAPRDSRRRPRPSRRSREAARRAPPTTTPSSSRPMKNRCLAPFLQPRRRDR